MLSVIRVDTGTSALLGKIVRARHARAQNFGSRRKEN